MAACVQTIFRIFSLVLTLKKYKENHVYTAQRKLSETVAFWYHPRKKLRYCGTGNFKRYPALLTSAADLSFEMESGRERFAVCHKIAVEGKKKCFTPFLKRVSLRCSEMKDSRL